MGLYKFRQPFRLRSFLRLWLPTFAKIRITSLYDLKWSLSRATYARCRFVSYSLMKWRLAHSTCEPARIEQTVLPES